MCNQKQTQQEKKMRTIPQDLQITKTEDYTVTRERYTEAKETMQKKGV